MRKWLIDRRRFLGMTQQNVAIALGVSQQYYNLFERGKREKKMKIDTAFKLSDILKIPIEEIIKEERG